MRITSATYTVYDRYPDSWTANRAVANQRNERVRLRIGSTDVGTFTPDLPDNVAQGAVTDWYSGEISGSFGADGTATSGGAVLVRHAGLYGFWDGSNSIRLRRIAVEVERCGATGSTSVVAANSRGGFGPVAGTTTEVGLLVAGRLHVDRGRLFVNSDASVVVNDLVGLDYLRPGGTSCIVRGGTSGCVDPSVVLQGGGGTTVTGRPFDFAQAFDDYDRTSSALAALPGACAAAAPVELRSPNGTDPWSGSGDALLRLTPGVTNVWTLSESELAAANGANLIGGATPSATTPVVVNVTSTDGDIVFAAPTWFQGDAARHVIWNFPGARSVTSTGVLWGSLYAPSADVSTSSDVRGVVVANTFRSTGGVVDWDRRPEIEIACPRPT